MRNSNKQKDHPGIHKVVQDFSSQSLLSGVTQQKKIFPVMGLEEGKLESSDLVMGSTEELAIFSTGMNLNSGTTGPFNIR